MYTPVTVDHRINLLAHKYLERGLSDQPCLRPFAAHQWRKTSVEANQYDSKADFFHTGVLTIHSFIGMSMTEQTTILLKVVRKPD